MQLNLPFTDLLISVAHFQSPLMVLTFSIFYKTLHFIQICFIIDLENIYTITNEYVWTLLRKFWKTQTWHENYYQIWVYIFITYFSTEGFGNQFLMVLEIGRKSIGDAYYRFDNWFTNHIFPRVPLWVIIFIPLYERFSFHCLTMK